MSTLLTFTVVLSACACSDQGQGAEQGSEVVGPSSLTPSAYELPVGKAIHKDALATADLTIENTQAEVVAKPKSWTTIGRLASAHANRGRLTGSIDDYVQADAALVDAFEAAPEGVGPYLTRAHIDFSLHRFAAAEQALDITEQAILIDDPTYSAIHGLRGELRLQANQISEAEALLNLAEQLSKSPTTASRRAQVSWRRGDYPEAKARYLEGLSRYHGFDPSIPAWFHLQLGIMELERMDYDAALVHFMDANAELSGYYLIEEHIAEVWTLQGRHGEALGLYLDIVERTQNPEFMDAVAGLHILAGDPADAEPWVARANEAYEAQLAAHPELAYGHALGHFIEFGPSDRAVEIAKLNFDLRPNGDARAELIRAYVSDGRHADAIVEADILASGEWRTANTLLAVHEAYAAAERSDDAVPTAARTELCALAPKACPEG